MNHLSEEMKEWYKHHVSGVMFSCYLILRFLNPVPVHSEVRRPVCIRWGRQHTFEKRSVEIAVPRCITILPR